MFYKHVFLKEVICRGNFGKYWYFSANCIILISFHNFNSPEYFKNWSIILITQSRWINVKCYNAQEILLYFLLLKNTLGGIPRIEIAEGRLRHCIDCWQFKLLFYFLVSEASYIRFIPHTFHCLVKGITVIKLGFL